MLVTSDPGERYALGFHGEGTLLVTPTLAQYSTDGRYIEAAREQIACAEVLCVSRDRRHNDLAADFIRAHNLKKVGFESNAMTVDDLARLEKELPCQLVPSGKLLETLRASKDAEEQAAMRQAQKITDEAFTAILDFLRPGLTEREVAARLVYEMMRRGGEKVSFDPIVAAGPNGSRPHAVPGSRVIEKGMFVTMDFGCMVNGYCSDMTRTVAVGEPTEEMRAVYQAVLDAQRAGIAAAKAGVPGRSIHAAAVASLEKSGYAEWFTHGFGHGLGLEVHESPGASGREDAILPVGAAISAEPGVYLPGRFGVRIEDVLFLTEEGCEDITGSPKELLVL